MTNRVAAVIVCLLIAAANAGAQGADIRIERAAQPPKIDVVLDDAVWMVPGTVFHAGYGSLYERGPNERFPNDANSPVRLDERYRATNRGVFFKASYLRRF